MKTWYRAFTPDFCRHMRIRTAWPPNKAAQPWFRQDIGGLRPERYKKLKEGEALDEKCALSLVRMLRGMAALARPNHEGKMFAEYLAGGGITSPGTATIDEIVACVCGPRLEKPPVSVGAIDYLQQGVAAIGEVFNTRRMIERYQQNCASDDDFHDAATWLFVSGGRFTAPENANLCPDEALIAAKNYIGTSRDEYAERLRRWHAFSPWTVVLARGNKRPNAVSVVLPLSDAAYDDLLGGRRPTYDCHPELLQIPTRKLLIEIVAERPHDLGAERANPTRGIFANIFAQCSVFLRPLDPVQPEIIRLLSYADMPLFVKRLKASGFKSTGCRMHTTGIPFFEKTVNTKTARGKDAIMVAFLRHFSAILDSPPPD